MSGAGSVDAAARVRELVGLFVTEPAHFGTILPVEAAGVPEPFRTLLDHQRHMTVAMERHHGGPVALRVVSEKADAGAAYAREILLAGPDGRTVQHGIVRIDLDTVDAAIAADIRAGRVPLGRVLLGAGVLCDVGDVALLQVVPGPHLRSLIGPRPTFGRVATIAIAGRPAVELLEIVAAG